jgi:hypothetical protein
MPSADPQRVPFDPFASNTIPSEKSPFYTKVTFNSLSELIVVETTRAQENGRFGPEAVERLTDALFLAPRLTQWHEQPQHDSDTPSYELWAKDDLMHVTVTTEEVKITKGIRNFSVIKGLQAETLHKAIATAQEILKPVKPIAEADAEEFFGGPSDADGSDLDAALADSPAGDVKPEGYFSTGDLDDDEELSTIIGDAVETVEAESQSLEANIDAAVETAEAVEEFEGNERQAFEPQPVERNTVAVKDRAVFAGYIRCSYCGGLNPHAYKGACPQCPKHSSVALAAKDDKPKTAFAKSWKSIHEGHVSDEWVLARYKSLQGRVLNIVEAAIGDKEQRAAIKTLVNKEFRREMSNVKGSSPLAEE